MKADTWYCAGWSRELTSRPLGRRILARHVVLFRDSNRTARALEARCPHRGANLARGAVVDGCIQCPFHGWRFDGDGRCVRVPSQPEHVKISTLARVPSFPLQEREERLWIWMGAGEAPNEPPRASAPQDGRPVRRLFFAAQLIDAPFLSVLENTFDKAHLPFIHRRSFGSGQNPLVAQQRVVVDAGGRGLRAEDAPDSAWQVEPKLPRGAIGLAARVLLGLRTPSAQHTRFDVEGGLRIHLEYPNGTWDRFVTHLTPADETRTWLFVESERTRAPHSLGDWVQRRAVCKVLAEGELETSLILAAADDDPRSVSVESDRLGLAARHLYEHWAAGTELRADSPSRPS